MSWAWDFLSVWFVWLVLVLGLATSLRHARVTANREHWGLSERRGALAIILVVYTGAAALVLRLALR